jgi:pimeloyl-ACP methyl ester carboxylesterase
MQSNVEEVRAAMDMLRKRIGAEHFILAGLCGGAGFSFLAARDDARVSRAILINVAFEEHPEIQHRRNMDFYWRFAFFNPRSWLRVLSGKSNYWGILKTLAYNVKRILFNEKRLDVEKDAMASTARDGLHSMLRRGVHLLVVYSEWDLGFYGFQAVFKDDLKQSASAGQLTLKVISKTDHTFTQLRAQRQLFQVLEDWLTPLVKP